MIRNSTQLWKAVGLPRTSTFNRVRDDLCTTRPKTSAVITSRFGSRAKNKVPSHRTQYLMMTPLKASKLVKLFFRWQLMERTEVADLHTWHYFQQCREVHSRSNGLMYATSFSVDVTHFCSFRSGKHWTRGIDSLIPIWEESIPVTMVL